MALLRNFIALYMGSANVENGLTENAPEILLTALNEPIADNLLIQPFLCFFVQPPLVVAMAAPDLNPLRCSLHSGLFHHRVRMATVQAFVDLGFLDLLLLLSGHSCIAFGNTRFLSTPHIVPEIAVVMVLPNFGGNDVIVLLLLVLVLQSLLLCLYQLSLSLSLGPCPLM